MKQKKMNDDSSAWAREQWESALLGDRRRNKRVIKVAEDILRDPQASLPVQIEEWSGLKAAYRLLNSPKITHEILQRDHWKKVANQASKIDSPVLFIQDTSDLDFSSRQISDIGLIGSHCQRGLMLHSVLAVVYSQGAQETLGLAYQRVWTRSVRSHKKIEKKHERKYRETEANLWKNALVAIDKDNYQQMGQWVSIGDRGSDIFDFLHFCMQTSWRYVVRACQNRLIVDANNEKTHLKDWIRKQPAKTTKEIFLRQRNGIQSGTTTLQVSWEKTRIVTPCNTLKKNTSQPIDVHVVRCWNDTTDDLEWILLTNLAVENAQDALERISWYEARWTIEEYHKCLKTGCGMEKRQLRSSGALQSMLGFLGIIATRLLNLRHFSRQNPNALAQEVVPEFPLKILCAHYKLDPSMISVQKFWHSVAKLGGFIGRKSDGDPGWQTLWKGWLRLSNMIDGAYLFKNCG